MHFKSWISDWYRFILTEMCIVLLKISDQFLFGFQLVSQAAELFLMGLPVTLDLLLNSILNTNTRIKIKINIQTEQTHLYACLHISYLHLIGTLNLTLLLHCMNFLCGHKHTQNIKSS